MVAGHTVTQSHTRHQAASKGGGRGGRCRRVVVHEASKLYSLACGWWWWLVNGTHSLILFMVQQHHDHAPLLLTRSPQHRTLLVACSSRIIPQTSTTRPRAGWGIGVCMMCLLGFLITREKEGEQVPFEQDPPGMISRADAPKPKSPATASHHFRQALQTPKTNYQLCKREPENQLNHRQGHPSHRDHHRNPGAS